MKIIPITFKTANAYVTQFHRHHKPTVGCKFCIGCEDGGQFVGVAICGRPVSRHYDNGITLEINRLCTNGTLNACSKLYGACVRIAREMGYSKVITYILASEDGASLKASNFVCEGKVGGTIWTGARKRDNGVPQEMKWRYVYHINKDKGGKELKFSDLRECPFCGSDEFFEKQYAYGTILIRERFDGQEADNSDLYDKLNFRYSGRIYCSQCKRVLGNRIKDTVSKSVEKELKDGEINGNEN